MQRSVHGYTGTHGFPVKNQKIHGRRSRKSGGVWLWKLVGAVVTLAMICGVVGTFLVGLQIRNGLDELVRQQQNGAVIKKVNTELYTEKKSITSKEHIEALAAVRLGLYAPSAGSGSRGMQVARP
ncbi:MAG: hypothetical protein H8E41_12065 [Desulfobulbaceae bacterium]|uniref:Cell division protein FtsL n=1 Tax=Candidatus Desulfobia pelagia TaxID=2841692 RepID=A0A8J6NFT2_9BACT|nr:hypothetical protein [Candidatus Desulfobia pelagia]